MAVIENAKVNIVDSIKSAIQKSIDSGSLNISEIPNVIIEVPKDNTNGDFACTIPMQLAKLARTAPRKIAEIIVSNIGDIEFVEKVEIAGAGFINFYLTEDFLYESLKDVRKEGNNYGKINIGNGKKVMVEFVSANPTGPMHMGNARGGALGDVIAEVLSWSGYDVTREFYLNDAGNQIEKFKKSLDIRYQQELGDQIELPEDCYQGQDIVEHAKEFIKEKGEGYLSSSEEERRQVLCDFALPRNISKLKEDLESYRINYDVWFSEKSLYQNKDIEETLETLKNSGYTYEKDGALWIKGTELGLEKDEVLVRNNGIPTYFTGDIAYHRNKFVKRGFDWAIDIWGADHHGHIARMKSAMKAVGCNPDSLEVITMQLVRLLRDGELARMSKRSGNAITLADLIEEIGVDAARFFFNMRGSSSQLDFDLDLAVKQSNENPVFYVQYAHARTCSIIKQLEAEGIKVPKTEELDFSVLKSEQETKLIKKISDLPDEIRISAETLDPSRMTRYVMDLAGDFHSFYNSCRVKGEEEKIMKARLFLVDCTRQVVSNVLGILGVVAPKQM